MRESYRSDWIRLQSKSYLQITQITQILARLGWRTICVIGVIGGDMLESGLELRAPETDEEWRAFHGIRRKVLFENRGKSDYLENHPDDSKIGNYPLVLISQGDIIGVIRVDVRESEAWLRRVAIREDLQRQGHGRALLRLAENFALKKNCTEVRTNAAVESVGFYERCGYMRDIVSVSPVNSVAMRKSLR
jgi:GNAT superfamily N-acetyltransferase